MPKSVEMSAPGIVLVARDTEAVAIAIGVPAMLGRTVKGADGTTIEVDDDRMSREHASVAFERGHWLIADQQSRNGTFVNGQRIEGQVRRRGTNVVRLGNSVFVLVDDARAHLVPIALGDALVVGPELACAHDEIRRAADRDVILINGEPGSGKEVAARVYHEASARRGGAFVAVGCATLPEAVAERLMFGARKGVIESIGHFQMARGGTIFLDDVSALGSAVQARLRRVIDDKQIEPVGAAAPAAIDVGIVAGGHSELRLAVGDGRFDAELYKRMARTTVDLPPLRDRRVDIARLVQREVAAAGPKLRPHAKLVEACLVRAWPSNVRELLTAVRKAAAEALANAREIVRVEDLEPAAGVATAQGAETAVERPRGTAPAEIDKAAIEAALVRAGGVVHLAARVLGIHRSQLYALMDKHGIVFTDEG